MQAYSPIGHRIAKGSFGPSFASAEDTKEAYSGDAQDSEDGSGRDEGEQKNGKKRQGGSRGRRPRKRPKKALGSASSSPICPCCGQFHRLARCFYVFPQLAPEGFIEREHLRSRTREALLDPDLQKEVEKLTAQLKSQS